MVRQITEYGQPGAPDCIPHECLLVETRSGYLVMIDGGCESVEDAEGEAIAVAPHIVANLEAWR